LYSVELFITINSSEKIVSLLLLEGDILVSFAVGPPVISLWEIVKRHGLLLRGSCEVVVELASSKWRKS
jgi:hypothetical protein